MSIIVFSTSYSKCDKYVYIKTHRFEMNCETCNNTHDGSYASGRFCTPHCARKFSQSFSTIGDTKKATCRFCPTIIEISKRASVNTATCPSCKKEHKHKKSKSCKMCGTVIYGRKKICKHKFCRKFNLVNTLIEKFGLPESSVGTSKYHNEFQKIVDVVSDEYYNQKLSSLELAEKYGTSPNGGNFTKIMKNLGIDTRNLREACINAYTTGRSVPVQVPNQYTSGWHTTWNNKQVYYRSSYELDYAKQLDVNKIDYDMEHHRILYWDTQQKYQRTAVPDFYLHESNTIVEIKSDYFLDKQNMIDKFKAYHKLGFHTLLIVDGVETELEMETPEVIETSSDG